MRPVHLLVAALVAVVPRAASAGDGETRTADLYKRFTYLNVTSTEADRIFSDLKIPSTFNPRRTMPNPDATWLPGWDKLELTDETKTAVLQAAINRTWTAKVDKDFVRYRAAWAAIDKQFRPELEKTKTGTYYARAAALGKLLAAVRKQAAADKVLYPDGTPPATVGFVDDIVLAMVALHRETRHEFMLQQYLQRQNINLADFEAGGRPFADNAIERDVFVAFSQAKGNLETPALPLMSEYGHAFAAVKWPTEKKAAAAKQATAKAIEANAAALAPKVAMARVPSLFNGDLGGEPDPKLRWIDPTGAGGADSWSPLKVTRVSGTTVELETNAERSLPYACKDTNQLDTTNSGRTWVQDCKYKHEVTKHTLSVTFAELPDGIELEKGDVVALWGDVESSKETKAAVRRVITARALASVKRGAQVVWQQ